MTSWMVDTKGTASGVGAQGLGTCRRSTWDFSTNALNALRPCEASGSMLAETKVNASARGMASFS